MLLQQTGIPDNVPYLILGLAVLAAILGGYVVSFYWRARGLRRDAALLAQMELQDDELDSPAAPPAEVSGGAEAGSSSAHMTS